MSSIWNTFHCYFSDMNQSSATHRTLSKIEQGTLEWKEITTDKNLKDANIEYISINESYLEFQIQQGATNKPANSVIDYLLISGAKYLIIDIYNDQVGDSKKIYYIDGNKVKPKDYKQLLPILPIELRLILTFIIQPVSIGKLIKEIGGYNTLVGGKPIIFYLLDNFNYCSYTQKALKAAIDDSNLNLIDLNTGNNVLHYVIENDIYDTDLLEKLIKRGTSVKLKNHRGDTPLFSSLNTRSSYAAWKIIELSNESPNSLDNTDVPFIYRLIEKEGINEDLIAEYVKTGADFSIVSPIGNAAWIAKKSSPKYIPLLPERYQIPIAGTHTYTGDSTEDLFRAISFMDDEKIRSCISSANLIGNAKELLQSCLHYGYYYGYSTLESINLFSKKASDFIEIENSYKKNRSLLEYIFDSISYRRDINGYMDIAKLLIIKDDTKKLEETLRPLRFIKTDRYPKAFIELFKNLNDKGVDMSTIKIDGIRSHKNFNSIDGISRVDFLESLLALKVDLHEVVDSIDYIDDEAHIFQKFLKSGFSQYYLRNHIYKKYHENTKSMIEFLLDCDLKKEKVQSAIWRAFIDMMLHDRKCPDFKKDIKQLIDAGLPYAGKIFIYGQDPFTPYRTAFTCGSELADARSLLNELGVSKEADDKVWEEYRESKLKK